MSHLAVSEQLASIGIPASARAEISRATAVLSVQANDAHRRLATPVGADGSQALQTSDRNLAGTPPGRREKPNPQAQRPKGRLRQP